MALQASALPVPRRAGLPLWEQIPLIFHQPFQPVRRAGRLCCMEEGWALLYGGRLGSVVWRKAVSVVWRRLGIARCHLIECSG